MHLEKISRKGQGRTFWIVITAVVALVVLVVLLMIFTGKVGMLETGLMSCEGKGGECIVKGDTCPAGTTLSRVFNCPEGEDCCIGAAKKELGESCAGDWECLSGECLDGRCV